jgi:hypothetical protein
VKGRNHGHSNEGKTVEKVGRKMARTCPDEGCPNN